MCKMCNKQMRHLRLALLLSQMMRGTTVRGGESSSRVPDVPQCLGLSINLSLLSSTPNYTTTTTAPPESTDPFRQPVGPTHLLSSTTTAIDFLPCLVMTF